MVHENVELQGVDHIRFVVGNARQSAYFYRNAFGFDIVAYSGLETGVRHEAGYVLTQGDITFVLASPLGAIHQYNQRLTLHGDGVADIAFAVSDVTEAYSQAIANGATPVRAPAPLEDKQGVCEVASIKTFGDTTHTFIDRRRYRGVFMPGYLPLEADRYSQRNTRPGGLKSIDHLVGNVDNGTLSQWVKFYEDVLGFERVASGTSREIGAENTTTLRRSVAHGKGDLRISISEPGRSRQKSLTDEFLEFYRGAGVQHIAFTTANIFDTVVNLKANDVSFLPIPVNYQRPTADVTDEEGRDWELFNKLGVMMREDSEGILLQVFTKPVSDRPTLFFEIVERLKTMPELTLPTRKTGATI